MILQSMRLNSLALAIFSLIAALILAAIYDLTGERIAQSERLAAQRALLEIVPLERHNNDLLMDVQPVPERFWSLLGLKKGGYIHLARRDGQPLAAIIPSVSAEGYSGDIAMIIGVNFDGTIAGVRVVEHGETPGLGDKIELKKSNWILKFNHRSLTNPAKQGWEVKRRGGDFDQFTGATITPRAVIQQIVKTLQYFDQDATRLLVVATENTAAITEQPETVTDKINQREPQ